MVSMPNFKKYSYDQSAMVVINFEQQLRPNTFEFTLHHLIDSHIDLSAFYDKYKNDGGGRTAYDPAILLKIILFAYYKGVRSSRDIQWECENNIIFKALSCDTVPHYTGIASFISSHPESIESVFEQVLLVCDEQGLLGHELIAIDGCKMSSNAAKEHSGTLSELEQKRDKIHQQIKHCMQEHKRLDKSKPKEQERKEQLAQSITTLGKHFEKLDKFLKKAAPRMGQGKKPKEIKSNITDSESGKMLTSKGTIQGYNGIAAVDKKHQIVVDAQVFGESSEHHTLKPVLDNIKARYKRINISDDILKDQIIVTADTGFSNQGNNEYLYKEGINAYIPDNQFRSRDPKFAKQKEKHGKRHQDTLKGVKSVIPSSEFIFDVSNKTCHCPEGNAMWLKNEKRDADGKLRLSFEANLTDCRHCKIKNQCMRNPGSADTREGHGRQTSITLNTRPTATDWMKERVDSQLGKTIYGHRMSVVEPVFGNIGTNRKLNRFSLRSKKKVQGQWQLYSLVHNIEKLMRYGAIA
jgi:transposase